MLIKKVIRSFGYAIKGIATLVRLERNARIHLLATTVVAAGGFYVGLDRYEWLAICISIGIVWAAEAFNTAIEKTVDMISPQKHPQAGLIKDLAAAGVLLCTITSIVVAAIVFLPYITK